MFRAVVILAALAACGRGDEDRLAKVKIAVCACKTAGCAELAMKDVPQSDVKSNHRTQQLARDMLDCLAKLYDEARPHDGDDGDDGDGNGSAAADEPTPAAAPATPPPPISAPGTGVPASAGTP